MSHKFSYYEKFMYKDPTLKIKRKYWKNKYIMWSDERQLFIDNGQREWCWDTFEEAKKDILSADWTKL